MRVLLMRCPRCKSGPLGVLGEDGELIVYLRIQCLQCRTKFKILKKEVVTSEVEAKIANG